MRMLPIHRSGGKSRSDASLRWIHDRRWKMYCTRWCIDSPPCCTSCPRTGGMGMGMDAMGATITLGRKRVRGCLESLEPVCGGQGKLFEDQRVRLTSLRVSQGNPHWPPEGSTTRRFPAPTPVSRTVGRGSNVRATGSVVDPGEQADGQ